MSDIAPEYEQRQRRLAPLQNDPEWKEWRSDPDIGLAHFFTNVVTDMPADQYSREGLQHAESAALRIFPVMNAANPDKSEENDLIIDPFQRYIGEVFVRKLRRPVDQCRLDCRIPAGALWICRTAS